MRITLLNQYYAPDEAPTAQFLSDLGKALAAGGHEVRAIACDRSYADPRRTYPSTEVIDGVSIVRVRSTGFGRGNALGRVIDYATYYAGTALRLLFGRRPDAVVALTTPPMIALLASLVGAIRKFPTIFWSMDVYPDIAYELGTFRRTSLAGRWLGVLSRLTLRRAACTIALGETMAEHLTRLGARRVEVVHNWAEESVELPETERQAEARALRKEWGWNDQFVLMYSGNMGLAHEFDTIIDVARRLQIEESDVLVSFVGGGPRRAEVQRRVEELRLKNVEFRGYVDRSKLGASLTSPDVHLVTLRESMPGLLVPSKIYGILAAGKPTLYVGPYRGEIFDLLQSGDCGSAVAIGDVEGCLEAIQRYRTETGWRELQGSNARTLYEARFRRAAALERFRSVVEEVALGR